MSGLFRWKWVLSVGGAGVVALAQAAEMRFAVPPVPLPPLPPARSVEDFIGRRGAPAEMRLPLDVFFGCGGAFDEAREVAALGLIELFGSAVNFETALAARRVEVARLWPRIDLWTSPAERSAPVRLTTADVARLRRVLTSDASYLWDGDSEGPTFSGGLRVTFHHAGRSVKVDLYPAEGVVVAETVKGVSWAKLGPVLDGIEGLAVDGEAVKR